MVDCSFQRLIIYALFSISVFDSDLQRRQRVERVLIASFACLTSFSLLLAFWIVSDSMVDCSFKRPCLSLLSMLSFLLVHLTLTFVPLQRRQRGRESIDSEVKIMKLCVFCMLELTPWAFSECYMPMSISCSRPRTVLHMPTYLYRQLPAIR